MGGRESQRQGGIERHRTKEPCAYVRFLPNFTSVGISNETSLKQIKLFGGKLNCCVSSSNSYF